MMIDEKTATSLVSVAVGWLLGQGTALMKGLWSRRRLKRGLLTELEDLRHEAYRVRLSYQRHLQFLAHDSIDPSQILPISNFYFKQNYKDILSSLNREQRFSYQLIHAHVDALNREGESLAKFAAEVHDRALRGTDAPPGSELVAWGNRVKMLFGSARILEWYLAHHFKNPHHPRLEPLAPEHAEFSRFVAGTDKEAAEIIERAKDFSLEQLMGRDTPQLMIRDSKDKKEGRTNYSES